MLTIFTWIATIFWERLFNIIDKAATCKTIFGPVSEKEEPNGV